jgi:(3S)-malyl-CoA thioesterase
MSDHFPLAPRSVLYLPAANARAIDKVQSLSVDMVILDLEDAVKPDQKGMARTQAVAAVKQGFGERICAIRINGENASWHADDLAAVALAKPDFVVIPKVEETGIVESVWQATGVPVLAMIETPYAILHAQHIVVAQGIAGLIAGTNDLAHELRLPPLRVGRSSLSVALQTIILAARMKGIWAFDGVFNVLDDADGFEAECAEGRSLGFDGKTLIHPNQIGRANRAFSPSKDELEDAAALLAAASGGAERFRDRMIETMHVDTAKRMLARANRL